MQVASVSSKLDTLVSIIEKQEQGLLLKQIQSLHEADAAELIELLTPSYRQELMHLLGEQFNPVILTYMNENVRDSVIDFWAHAQLSSALSKLDESDAIELLNDLTLDERKNLLRTLKPELRIALEESLSYPEETAGRLMMHEFIALPSTMLVLQATAFLHGVQKKTLESGMVFLVNDKRVLMAQLDFGTLFLADPSKNLLDVSQPIECSIQVFDDINHITLMFRKYFVSTIPVLDPQKKIVGILQLHNMIDSVYDHAEQSLLQSAGVEESDFYKTIWSSIFSRLKWIVVAGLYSLVSAWIISIFQDVIAKHAIIPALNQVLLASTGVAGMQAVTVTTRALIDKDLISVNTMRAIRKEMMIGVINGLILAPLLMILLLFNNFNGDYMISVIFGISVFFGLIIANLAGSVIPIILTKCKIDPSIGSASLLASFADASGLLIIFSLAKFLL